MKQYSDLSYTLTRDISKKDKKNNGIYFTPPNTVSKNIDFLEKYLVDFKDVLEPSCGSCEYILQLNEKHKHLEITGIELNKKIYDSVKELENEKITIYNDNYLTYKNNKKYDLIIGNPPYFVMKKNDVDKEYYNYFDGRPNIFILFIIKSLKLLKNNGIILFFVPFSWRYHASPYDTYRYSHTGLQFIIERLGCIKKIQSGYIKFGNINGFWKNKKDYTINGKQFPNCLETFYLGIKNNTHKFTINDLDADYNWRHDK